MEALNLAYCSTLKTKLPSPSWHLLSRITESPYFHKTCFQRRAELLTLLDALALSIRKNSSHLLHSIEADVNGTYEILKAVRLSVSNLSLLSCINYPIHYLPGHR